MVRLEQAKEPIRRRRRNQSEHSSQPTVQGWRHAVHPLLASVGFVPNGVELKAERRTPSGEKHRDIEDIPSLTGVLAHFRLH